MKIEIIRHKVQLDKFWGIETEGTYGILGLIDAALKEHGLEIVVGETNREQHYIKEVEGAFTIEEVGNKKYESERNFVRIIKIGKGRGLKILKAHHIYEPNNYKRYKRS